MKSLERRFNNIARKNTLWSSYVCFAEAVREQKFSKRIIAYWFHRLIEKQNYARKEKRELLTHLNQLSIS